MLYIDKSKNAVEGNQITYDYLQNCCMDTTTGRYSNVCYDKRDGYGNRFCTIDSGVYRKRMIDVLLKNQSGYCCYCMRKLNRVSTDNTEKVTIEHIIPRGYNSSNNSRLDDYRQVPNLSTSEIVLKDSFEESVNQQVPPFPHNVAYNNMVASCLGTFPDKNNANTPICCNIVRKEKYAYPIFYQTNIQQDIIYGTDGGINVRLECQNYEEARLVISATQIYVRPLRDIRRLWYELRNCDYKEIYTCDTEEKRNLLLSRYLTSLSLEDKRKFISKFKKDSYWHTFMLYRKFYSIMRLQHP